MPNKLKAFSIFLLFALQNARASVANEAKRGWNRVDQEAIKKRKSPSTGYINVTKVQPQARNNRDDASGGAISHTASRDI